MLLRTHECYTNASQKNQMRLFMIFWADLEGAQRGQFDVDVIWNHKWTGSIELNLRK